MAHEWTGDGHRDCIAMAMEFFRDSCWTSLYSAYTAFMPFAYFSTLSGMIIEGMKPPGSITIRIAMVRMSRVIMTEHVGRNNRRALRRMLIIIPKRIFITPGPIFRIHTSPHQTVKDRIRPIPYLGHQTVFFRIDMYIIHMGPVILFIGYEMLPIPSLPDASLPLVVSKGVANFLWWVSCFFCFFLFIYLVYLLKQIH